MVEKTTYIPSFYDQIPLGGVEYLPTGADKVVLIAELLEALENLPSNELKVEPTKQILEAEGVTDEVT